MKNFERVLSTIQARYEDLLEENELRFMTQFPRLPLNSRALLTRMVMRRGELFRASKVRYPEIGDTPAAAAPLIEAGWICSDPKLNWEQIFELLTKTELICCLELPPRLASRRKADLKIFLQTRVPERRYFSEWYGADDCVYLLMVERMCERFRLMFFGNHGRGWAEFVTAELGIFQYEQIEKSLQSRPFQSRTHIEVFERIEDCRQLLAMGMPLAELDALVPGSIADSEWLEELRQRLLFLIARQFERQGEFQTALDKYLSCNYRGARSRAIQLKIKLKYWEDAHLLCNAAWENSESAAELQIVRRMRPRIHRKLKLAVPIDAAPAIPEFEIVLEGDAVGAVEYRVRDYLARTQTERGTVRYVENALVPALFGLLCWPAIFAPVPGAFFHDFHHGPIDLESTHFCSRRRVELERCLGHLDSGTHADVIWKVFKQKWGIRSAFVRWRHLDRKLLRWALDCIPAAHLLAWFQWILRDLKDNRAGFPDLVQFYPREHRYRMIEVKGPGDRVQDNQRRLLEYCVLHRMPVSVCYVKPFARP